ncbi:ABC transporter substrate-binding protein [Streptosporangium sp. NPDC006013]|uniref:ABC transporter substrate-binding protein n=1 Tax=Streptosporangium sp. NPDC006013 TaxID=3155596 RepID=UPI0033AF60FA
MRRKLTAVIGLSALAGSLVACGGADSSEGTSNNPIVIGYDGDLSGPFSIGGQGAHKGIEAYVNATNAAGGIAGRKLQLVTLDDGGDVNRALGNIQQLLTQKKADVLIGISISSICEAATDMVAKAKVPLDCVGAAPSQVAPPNASPWVFMATSGQDYQVAPVLQLIEKTVTADKPKVAYIHFDSAAHHGFGRTVTAALQRRSWPLVAREVVPLTASPDIRAQASKLVAAKPDVVVSLMTDKNSALLQQNLRAQGFTGPIIQNPDTGPEIMNITKDENLYVLTHAYLDNTASDRLGGDANWKSMADAFAAAKLDLSTSYATRGYLNALVVGTALADCDGCSGEELRAAIEKAVVPSDGITPGDLKFSADDHQGAQAVPAYHWKDGGPALVEPSLKTGVN